MALSRLVDALLYAVTAGASAAGLIMVKAVLSEPGPLDAAGIHWPSMLHFLAGAAMYLAGAVAWAIVIARQPYSFAMPATIALTIAATQAGSHWYLNEEITALTIAGSAVVVLGLVLIGREQG